MSDSEGEPQRSKITLEAITVVLLVVACILGVFGGGIPEPIWGVVGICAGAIAKERL